MTDLLSIVIVNFNAGAHLKVCLDSIARHAGHAEVVVIDNASSDGSAVAADVQAPRVRLLRNAVNEGFARAVNQGIAQAAGRWILLLNPDCRLQQGVVDTLIRELQQWPECAAAGPRILDEDGSVQGSARGDPTLMTGLFGRRSLMTRWFPRSRWARQNVRAVDATMASERSTEVDWLSGACLMLRKEAVVALNGLDERYFLYWEDADLCRRLRDHGHTVRYVPAAAVVHTVGQSSRSAPELAIRAFHKSAFIYYSTHVARGATARLAARAILEMRCRWKLSSRWFQTVFRST
jgi:GT2 family glycosyltransferase